MISLSRRQFLYRSALASSLAMLPKGAWAKERPNLVIPPLLDVGRGLPVRLDFRATQTTFLEGKWVEAWGVNGQYLAPTVRVKSGDFVRLTYLNSLPQALSIHIQGLLMSTERLGSAHRYLETGSSWSPMISIDQAACTACYHADTMLNSALQLYRGLVGLWLIEDDASRRAALPNRYGVNDIPLILQDQQINKDGMQVMNPQANQFFGDRLFVNGRENPKIHLARGWVRLRLLNASLSRHYRLRLDNGEPLYWIATGMGMFAEPIKTEVLSLAPMERAEVLVNLNGESVVSLLDGEPKGWFEPLERWFNTEQTLQDNVVLEMHPEGLASALMQPPTLPPFDLQAFHLSVAEERAFFLQPSDRLINRQRFDPARIDVTVKQGTVERWYLHTTQAVGFSLQGAKFVVETRQRQATPRAELSWRDTVWLNADETVTLLVKFDHLASAALPFRFGATDAMLRDKGCMGQFVVLSY